MGVVLLSGAAAAPLHAAQGTAPLSEADRNLVVDMARANLGEIEAARMAQVKTKNPQVKQFAQRMIAEHGKALEDMRQLAQSKGVSLPATADSQHRKLGQSLNALSGAAFDRRYVAQSGVDDHKRAHALLLRVQTQAEDADVKALAAKMLPVVDQHLHAIEQLSATIAHGTTSGTSGTAGASGGGERPPRAH